MPARPRSAAVSAEERVAQLELNQTGLMRRISHLEKLLAEVEQGRQHYLSLFHECPVGYAELDEFGTVRAMNDALAALLQVKPDAPRQFPFAAHVLPRDLPLFLGHLRACKQCRRESSTQLRLGPNEEFCRPVSLVSVGSRFKLGKSLRICTAVIDESVRTAAEHALARTQQDYRQLMDSIEGVVWEALASTHHFLLVSKQVERLLGYPAERWMAEPGFWRDHIFVEDRERVLDAFARHVAAREDFTIEYRLIAADRRQVWVRDIVSIHHQGPRATLRGVTIDITDRMKAEESLRLSQQRLEERVAERTRELQQTVAELQGFSYSLSHDMRAPLRAMHSFAELALEQCSDAISPVGREFLRRIPVAAERLDQLIRDVLRYTSISYTPIALKKIDLQKLIQQVIHEYVVFQPPRAQIDVLEPLLPVSGDEVFLTQCVTNLLSNAVKFVAPGVLPRVKIGTQAINGQSVELWFEDNGMGIDDENQKRIFRIFHQAHKASRLETPGVGLAIVRRAVERMGGQVGVESAPGQGSRFWLKLKGAND